MSRAHNDAQEATNDFDERGKHRTMLTAEILKVDTLIEKQIQAWDEKFEVLRLRKAQNDTLQATTNFDTRVKCKLDILTANKQIHALEERLEALRLSKARDDALQDMFDFQERVKHQALIVERLQRKNAMDKQIRTLEDQIETLTLSKAHDAAIQATTAFK